jgi:hypothetical protein
MQPPGNSKNVFVVYADERKNMKDAERFGRLRDVFSSVGRNYNTPRMIEHARRTFEDWQEGDYLLLVGDPALCGLCMALVSERDDVINTLSWDRNDFQYVVRRWDFRPEALGVDPAD